MKERHYHRENKQVIRIDRIIAKIEDEQEKLLQDDPIFKQIYKHATTSAITQLLIILEVLEMEV